MFQKASNIVTSVIFLPTDRTRQTLAGPERNISHVPVSLENLIGSVSFLHEGISRTLPAGKISFYWSSEVQLESRGTGSHGKAYSPWQFGLSDRHHGGIRSAGVFYV